MKKIEKKKIIKKTNINESNYNSNFKDCNIVVVANEHRKPLILPFLKDCAYYLSMTPDLNLPDDWSPSPYYKDLVIHRHQHIGQHRCLEGHKLALQQATKDIILVFEDDCVPIRSDWFEIVNISIPLLDKHEIVSLHSREPNYQVFDRGEIKLNNEEFGYYYPKDSISPRRCLGTLCYLIKRETIPRIMSHNYNGLPIDIFFCNCFNFAFIQPSPFEHDRSQGSLIDLHAN